ncbi:MAG: hypothetical protein A3B47_03100 [Candidatus Levybacteria bacterium RIFCSPLOWO2_01_FULL_39_24]|nr:MAG: hypothetical protein A2800_02390 [Candidatus Levybacteria bacterium RIFCSPHIGHO2_01_FULL_40_16]OGH28098.1 MAG: hypothetical protein A3E12_03570 [Candidatus Levybacteria bacterium RIFCSPHIGHO2_12_FULL_39_9]OGH46607.1 MAG: hypothetical protein A3B47_03100 [Candidatus Levybacteria bacterium RIFCSPLOWO2_01_FULL_39_24]
MSVEVDYFSTSERRGEKCIGSHSVASGNWMPVKFLGKGSRIAVICSLNKDKGSIIITDPNGKLGATRYAAPEDNEGEEVDISSNPEASMGTYVEIAGEQMLSIYTENKKSLSEVLIYLDLDENHDQEVSPEDFVGPITAS